MRLAALILSLTLAAVACCADSGQVALDPSAVCVQTAEPPIIDGKLDDECWLKGPALESFALPGDKGLARKQTKVYLACDDRSIYVGFRCEEPRLDLLKTTEKEKIWRNDSVEVLIGADRTRTGYLHFFVDAAGGRLALSDGVPGEGSEVWDTPMWKSAVSRGDGEWTAEMSVSISGMGVGTAGDCIRANFARNEQELVERSSWRPRVGAFQNALHFGNVYLGSMPAISADLSLPAGFAAGRITAHLRLKNGGSAAVSVAPTVEAKGRISRLPELRLPAGQEVEKRVSLDLPEDAQCGVDVWCNPRGRQKPVLAGSYLVTLPPSQPKAVGAALSIQPWGTVWEACATSKVMPNAAVPRERAKGIDVSCARNEFEPFQIVISPKRDLKDVRARVSDLTGAGVIRGDTVSVRHVETVPVTQPTSSECATGDYPDPLVPFEFITAPAGRNTAFWFTVRVPTDARAGDYKGTITLSADGVDPVVVPLKLHVWDFALPEVSSLRTAYGCDYNAICRWYGASSIEDKRRIADLVQRDFIEHRVSPIQAVPFRDIETQTINGRLTGDFTDYDRAASVVVPRLSAFNLPGAFMGRIGRDGPGSDEYARLKLPFLKDLAAYLRSRGWLDKGYSYIYDEPREEDYAKVVAEAKLWREADPGLKILLTEQPEEPLFGYVDIWSPVLDAYKQRSCRQRQALGEQVWWYVCTGPKHPFPNNFIDYPAIDHRILHWMNWKYGVTGVLYWQTMFWTQNPWRSANTRSEDGRYFGNGDGMLLYPAVKEKSGSPLIAGPIDSIRWEMIREGIEDYDYLHMLDEAVRSAEARGDTKGAKDGKAALAAAAALVHNTASYEKDPRKLYAARRRVAEALERLGR